MRLALVLFLFSFSLFAQLLPFSIYNDRQNPSSLHWKELQTEHFKIIFPDFVEAQARKVASILEVIYPIESKGLKYNPQNISIVLHPNTMDSNAFVALAPWRSEWYLTPIMGPLISQTDWLSALAVHEFRHVVQIDKSKEGFGKFMKFILGESGHALAIGWSIPFWYFEGDAVGVETALSLGGRGRLPSFERDLRTILLSNLDYNYDQYNQGSFESYLPNHYVYGYFITTYLRKHYGPDILEKIHSRSADRAFSPFGFLNAIEKYTGKKFDKIFNEVLKELKVAWLDQVSKVSLIPSQSFKKPNEEHWTNYQHIQPNDQKGFYALKAGLSYIPQWISIDHEGTEKNLFKPAPTSQVTAIRARNNKIAFTEINPHPRWGMEDSSDVVIRDLKINKEIRRWKKTKFYSPMLSLDATKILALEWSEKQTSKLFILDLNKNVLRSQNFLPHQTVISADWIDDNDYVYLLRNGTYELQIWINQNNESTLLYQTSQWNLSHVTGAKDWVYFVSNQSGIDNIFRLHVESKKLEQVTSEAFGANYPSLHHDHLYFSTYSYEGFKPAFKALQSEFSIPQENSFVPHYKPLVEQEKTGDLLSEIKPSSLPIKKYSQTESSWNPHSWVLLAPPLTSMITAQVQSTDLLNNLGLYSGAQYSLTEQETGVFALARFSHYYPTFDLSALYTGRKKEYKTSLGSITDRWEESILRQGISIPGIGVSGAFNYQWRFGFNQKIIQASGFDVIRSNSLGNSTLYSPGLFLTASLLHRLSPRDLFSPMGLSTQIGTEKGYKIAGDDQSAFYTYAYNKFFLPGFFKHHSLFGELSFERQQENGYKYQSLLIPVRGQGLITFDRVEKKSINYAFPLFYPEWNWSWYLYVKRISFNFFYDRAALSNGSNDFFQESKGSELLVDFNLFRNSFPLGIGIRYVEPAGKNKNEPSFELFVTSLGGVF
jgi:hypothetical protein